jgi:uroporphyrinogen decarboxylase
MDTLQAPDKNRIAAVFGHRLPDRVPNFEVLIDDPTLSAVLGRSVRGLDGTHTLANLDPADYIDLAGKVGQDVVGMCFYDTPFRFVDSDGEVRSLNGRVSRASDLDRVDPRDLRHTEERFRLLERYEDAVRGSPVGLFALTGTVFTTAYDSLFGFDRFMYLTYDDIDLIERALEISTVFHVELVKRLVQADLTFLYIGDDVAHKHGTLVNPDILRRLWIPRMERIMAPARERGIPILFHSDGNILELIPDLLDIGVAAINPIEPYGMDIREVRKRFGSRLALVGNLDVGGSLARGTPAEVARDARDLIDAVGGNGGLVLASSHSITRNVPPENYLAMVRTAWESRY